MADILCIFGLRVVDVGEQGRTYLPSYKCRFERVMRDSAYSRVVWHSKERPEAGRRR